MGIYIYIYTDKFTRIKVQRSEQTKRQTGVAHGGGEHDRDKARNLGRRNDGNDNREYEHPGGKPKSNEAKWGMLQRVLKDWSDHEGLDLCHTAVAYDLSQLDALLWELLTNRHEFCVDGPGEGKELRELGAIRAPIYLPDSWGTSVVQTKKGKFINPGEGIYEACVDVLCDMNRLHHPCSTYA